MQGTVNGGECVGHGDGTTPEEASSWRWGTVRDSKIKSAGWHRKGGLGFGARVSCSCFPHSSPPLCTGFYTALNHINSTTITNVATVTALHLAHGSRPHQASRRRRGTPLPHDSRLQARHKMSSLSQFWFAVLVYSDRGWGEIT